MARMNVRILKDRGIYVEGQTVDMSRAQGEQWENSGFAEYVSREKKAAKPKPEPKADDGLYADMTVKELDAELKERELSTKGKKEDKVARLEEADSMLADHGDESKE